MAKKSIPAINESELDTEKPIPRHRVWIREHMFAVCIGAAILLIIAIFFGIRIYKNASHPLTKFMAASAKNFNSSFTFEAEAIQNGKPVMKYTGAYKADASKQNVKAIYEADYGSYTYTGAVFAEGDTHVSGSCYDKQWHVHDCTDRVLNFFDFNTDFKAGRFDGASFLRFTDMTSSYSADELNNFMKVVKSRMDGGSPLAKVDVTTGNGYKTYQYDISLKEFFDLVREKGASIFFSAIDYDAFCALYAANEETVEKAECRFVFTIDSAGWLTDMQLSVKTGDEEFAVECQFSDFGSAEVEIPEAFFDAADAQLDNEN